MFSNWIRNYKDILSDFRSWRHGHDNKKANAFIIALVILLLVGFFTNIQLLLAFLGIHYAMELVIKYDSRIASVIGYFRDRQRKRKELETAKWAEQAGKKKH